MSSSKNRINIIVALSHKTRAIGRNGELLWKLREDMKRFKELTFGHPVIMGRKTWESILPAFRPLKGRTNIVLTRNKALEVPEGKIAETLDVAIEIATKSPGSEEIFIIGGGEIYKEALPKTDRLLLTKVFDEPGGDTFFPEYKLLFPRIIWQHDVEGSNPLFWYETRERT